VVHTLLVFCEISPSEGDFPKLISRLDSAGDTRGEFPFPGEDFPEGIITLKRYNTNMMGYQDE